MIMIPRAQTIWVFVIPFLLLAGGLASRQMNDDAFSSDEVASMIVAGGAHFGPYTPIMAWNRVAEHSPDQAIGLALILSGWGQIFGWSEFAIRTLPFFAGLLALAWVFRLTRDLFSPAVGLVAVAFLALSVFFVTYMRVGRVFTIAALLVPFVLWCYWRVVLHPRKPGITAQMGLVVGCIGLLYAHYFAALLLIALGLYHVLMAPRNSRWWRALLLLLVAALVFLPEFNVFVLGYERNLGKDELHDKALTALESVSQLVYYFSNGSLRPGETGGLLLLVFISIVTTFYSYRMRHAISRNLVFASFVTITLLILILAANARLQVMTLQRIRYMMPLWPLLAILIGVGFVKWAQTRSRLPWLLLGGWFIFSLWGHLATGLQYQFDLFTQYPLHRARDELFKNGASGDLLVIDGFWRGDGRTREFYLGYGMVMDRTFIYPATTSNDMQLEFDSRLRIWHVTEDVASLQSTNLKAMLQEDFVHCDTSIDERFLLLDLYALADTFCSGGESLLSFGESITLTGVRPMVMNNGQLRVDMAWMIEPAVTPDTYSVGLYIFDAATNEFVAQADYGLPMPPFAPVRRHIDLSALPAGEYHVEVSVYDWKSGQRLVGTDRQSEVQSDLLLVGKFEIR